MWSVNALHDDCAAEFIYLMQSIRDVALFLKRLCQCWLSHWMSQWITENKRLLLRMELCEKNNIQIVLMHQSTKHQQTLRIQNIFNESSECFYVFCFFPYHDQLFYGIQYWKFSNWNVSIDKLLGSYAI